jgi:hypothetical protein
MTTAHTLGPWQAIGRNVETLGKDSEREIIAQVPNDGRCIASIYTREANARLIAAAPELLEALTNLCQALTAIDVIMDPTGDDEHDAADDYYEARCVLNKVAEGRAAKP